METFRRVTHDRVQLALSFIPIIAVCFMAALALAAVNGGRVDAQHAAEDATAEVQELQQQARCRDDLAAAVDQANTEALSGLALYIRALSSPAGDPGSVDWDSILARMEALQSASRGEKTPAVSVNADGVDFSTMLRDAVREVNAAQNSAQAQAQAFQLGDRSVSMRSGMPSLPRARIRPRVASASRCSETDAFRTAS